MCVDLFAEESVVNIYAVVILQTWFLDHYKLLHVFFLTARYTKITAQIMFVKYAI